MTPNDYKVGERTHHIGNGVHIIYRFPNGYGASVVRFMIDLHDGTHVGGSYGSEDGLWELGVTKWDGDKWELTYDTPIADDVIGYLTDADVLRTLKEIMELPA